MNSAIWFEQPIPPAALDHLGSAAIACGPDLEELATADAAVVGMNNTWDAAFVAEHAPALRVVARAGIGYDNLVLDELTAAGVMGCNAPDSPTVSTAEHAMALMLTVTKELGISAQRLRDATGNYGAASGAIELDGLTLGLVGHGRIGRRVRGACEALGMTTVVYDPYATDLTGVEAVELDDLLHRADVVSLHAPNTPETRHMINADTLAMMKPTACLINCARGALVDHDALLAAIDAGTIGSAGLDVTDPEPLPPGHPLLDRANVVVTPHIASSTTVGKVRLVTHAIDEALAALRGERPPNLLNPNVWKAVPNS